MKKYQDGDFAQYDADDREMLQQYFSNQLLPHFEQYYGAAEAVDKALEWMRSEYPDAYSALRVEDLGKSGAQKAEERIIKVTNSVPGGVFKPSMKMKDGGKVGKKNGDPPKQMAQDNTAVNQPLIGDLPVTGNSALIDPTQGMLDMLGYVPVIGDFSDIANAGIYASKGDYANAGLSVLGLLPFGNFLGKGLKKAANLFGKKGTEAAQFVLPEINRPMMRAAREFYGPDVAPKWIDMGNGYKRSMHAGDYSGRPIVVVQTPKGESIPFYLRTGMGGKAIDWAAPGNWVPFQGISDHFMPQYKNSSVWFMKPNDGKRGTANPEWARISKILGNHLGTGDDARKIFSADNMSFDNVSDKPAELVNDILQMYGFDARKAASNIGRTAYKDGGMIIPTSSLGQWQYPGQIVNVPSDSITMKGINHPNIGISDNGIVKKMMPGKDYKFPGAKSVTEIPTQYQDGAFANLGATAKKVALDNSYDTDDREMLQQYFDSQLIPHFEQSYDTAEAIVEAKKWLKKEYPKAYNVLNGIEESIDKNNNTQELQSTAIDNTRVATPPLFSLPSDLVEDPYNPGSFISPSQVNQESMGRFGGLKLDENGYVVDIIPASGIIQPVDDPFTMAFVDGTLGGLTTLALKGVPKGIAQRNINRLNTLKYELSPEIMKKRFSRTYQKEAKLRLKEANDWQEMWYNHPETLKRLKLNTRERLLRKNHHNRNTLYKAQLAKNEGKMSTKDFETMRESFPRIDYDDLNNYPIYQRIKDKEYEAFFPTKTGKILRFIKGEKPFFGPYADEGYQTAAGYSGYGLDLGLPSNKIHNLVNKYPKRIQTIGSNAVHEGSHGVTLANKYIDNTSLDFWLRKTFDPKLTKSTSLNPVMRKRTRFVMPKEDFIGYLKEPTENHARIQQIRFGTNAKPDRNIFPEDIRRLINQHRYFFRGYKPIGNTRFKPFYIVDNRYFQNIPDVNNTLSNTMNNVFKSGGYPNSPELEAMSKVLTYRNRDLPWIKRVLEGSELKLDAGNGMDKTHRLGYAGVDDGYIVYPTIIQEGDKLKEFQTDDEAIDYAFANKTGMFVPSRELAEYYSKNGLIKHFQDGAFATNETYSGGTLPVVNVTSNWSSMNPEGMGMLSERLYNAIDPSYYPQQIGAKNYIRSILLGENRFGDKSASEAYDDYMKLQSEYEGTQRAMDEIYERMNAIPTTGSLEELTKLNEERKALYAEIEKLRENKGALHKKISELGFSRFGIKDEDMWRVYLGLPQFNNTVVESTYKPTDAKDKNSKYYTISNKQELTDRSILGLGLFEFANKDGDVHKFPRVGQNTTGLANVTYDVGKDDRGYYISMYDIFDFAVPGSKALGKPYEIYDRFYIDDFKHVDPEHLQSLQEMLEEAYYKKMNPEPEPVEPIVSPQDNTIISRILNIGDDIQNVLPDASVINNVEDAIKNNRSFKRTITDIDADSTNLRKGGYPTQYQTGAFAKRKEPIYVMGYDRAGSPETYREEIDRTGQTLATLNMYKEALESGSVSDLSDDQAFDIARAYWLAGSPEIMLPEGDTDADNEFIARFIKSAVKNTPGTVKSVLDKAIKKVQDEGDIMVITDGFEGYSFSDEYNRKGGGKEVLSRLFDKINYKGVTGPEEASAFLDSMPVGSNFMWMDHSGDNLFGLPAEIFLDKVAARKPKICIGGSCFSEEQYLPELKSMLPNTQFFMSKDKWTGFDASKPGMKAVIRKKGGYVKGKTKRKKK